MFGRKRVYLLNRRPSWQAQTKCKTQTRDQPNENSAWSNEESDSWLDLWVGSNQNEGCGPAGQLGPDSAPGTPQTCGHERPQAAYPYISEARIMDSRPTQILTPTQFRQCGTNETGSGIGQNVPRAERGASFRQSLHGRVSAGKLGICGPSESPFLLGGDPSTRSPERSRSSDCAAGAQREGRIPNERDGLRVGRQKTSAARKTQSSRDEGSRPQLQTNGVICESLAK